MREIIDEHQPFVRDEIPADQAREIFDRHRFKLEIIDNASTDPMSGTGERGEVRTYENPPAKPKDHPPFHGRPGFIDLCRGPHVEDTSRHLGHFKLLRVAGAYWRGDEAQPAAPAHLRHRVGLEEGPRGPPPPPRGGRQARPPQARRRARPVPLPARGRQRPAAVPPQGRHGAQAHGGLQPGRAREGRLRVRVHAPHRQGRAVREERAPRVVRRRHVPPDGARRGAQVLPEAHELPDARADLPVAAAVVPRAAAAAVRVRHGVPLREVGRGPRPAAGPRLHAGRLAHLLHPRAAAPAS